MVDKKTRPLLLFGLASKNVFGPEQKSDYFSSLLPFFEPFLHAHNGALLSLEELKNYSRDTLRLPINQEVAEIFVGKMNARGWLTREQSSGASVLYRIRYYSMDDIDSRFKDLESDLSQLHSDIQAFSQQEFSNVAFPDQQSFEDDFLDFLFLNFTSGAATIKEDDQRQATHYVYAKFIAAAAEGRHRSIELMERLTGVTLMAEVLQEVRFPNATGIRSRSGVVVYLDGPLIMAALGLSGTVARDNIMFSIEHLKASNVSVEAFEHSCDEIANNLHAVLRLPPPARTGPTAEALRKGEVQEAYCQAVANNVRHYVQTFANIPVRSERLRPNDHREKFFPDNLIDILANSMPAQNPIARDRDAASIALVMRKREGQETTDFYASRFVFVTSNLAVSSAAANLLRDRGFLSESRNVIGPAVTSRTVAGLVFANAGVADKTAISRRQLLGACARVVMLRPRVVDQVREQFAQLARIDDVKMLDAILTQPRGAEVFMDYFVNHDETISPENHEELLKLMKRSIVEKEIEAAETAARAVEASKNEEIRLLQEKLAIQSATMAAELAEKQAALERLQRSVSPASHPLARAVEDEQPTDGRARTDGNVGGFPQVPSVSGDSSKSAELTVKPDEGAASDAAQGHVVLLVHGIRDQAFWQHQIRPLLQENGFFCEPTNYGRFDLVRFLLPFSVFRETAINEVEKQIRIVINERKAAKVSIIAHSFGTYVVAKIIERGFDKKFHRIIFCGSVVKYGFPFEQYRSRFDGEILNEVGAMDPWPAVAESVTFGYGAAGTFGFRRPLVRDRWHEDAGHSFFLTREFCEKYWIPFLESGTIVPSKVTEQVPRWWVRMLNVRAVRWSLGLASAALVVACALF